MRLRVFVQVASRVLPNWEQPNRGPTTIGNRRISEDVKLIALKLWDQGWEIEDICDILGVSRASLFRWHAIFEEHGTVICPPSPLKGQGLRVLTRTLIQACKDLFSQETDLFLDEVVAWLALTHDIAISTSTLSRNLAEAGLTRKILHKIAAERDEERRREFRELVHNNFQGDGSELIFIDETSKDERTWAHHYGRAMSGTQARFADVFVRGDRYSLVAAMAVDGYIAADVVEGSFDRDLFSQFVIEQVVCFVFFTWSFSHIPSQLPSMNPFPAEQSVIVLDNCRIHQNEDLEAALLQAGMFPGHHLV